MTEDTKALSAPVQGAVMRFADGDLTMTALLEMARGKSKAQESQTLQVLPEVSPLTELQKQAMSVLLNGAFGAVTATEPRLLNETELEALVAEREMIDMVLSALTPRKDSSIREALASHLDKVAENTGVAAGAKIDHRGHYLTKTSAKVPGLSKTVDRTVTDPKPVVSSAMLKRMHQEGNLSREDYLALTVVPEVDRVFDETKARKALRKNPGLFAKIAEATTTPDPVATIKVNKAK